MRLLLVEDDDKLARAVARGLRAEGDAVELSAREFALLEHLARRAGDVVTRSELIEHVWDENFLGSTNVVDVYVGYLRRKLGRNLIRTVRGVGFVLEPEA